MRIQRCRQIFKNLIAEAKEAGVSDKVQIVKTGCFGFCEKGPIVKVLPEDSFYVEVKPEDAKEIIREQIVKGREVTRLLYNKEKKSLEDVEEIQFYQKQLRIVLRNCGVLIRKILLSTLPATATLHSKKLFLT